MWALNIYTPFCSSLNYVAFPLDVNVLIEFITFLAIECEYKFNSIRNLVIPSLYRLHLNHTSEEFPYNSRLEIN